MPKFELYERSETRQGRSGGGAGGARLFAIMVLLWVAILLWASKTIFGL